MLTQTNFHTSEKKHNSVQETETDSISIEVNFIVTLKDLDASQIYSTDIWIPMTQLYGGVEGVKGFLKHKVTEIVHAYEDSNREIQSILLNKLYIQKNKHDLQVHFKEIKMYGTIFNYTGFGLQALNGKNTRCMCT